MSVSRFLLKKEFIISAGPIPQAECRLKTVLDIADLITADRGYGKRSFNWGWGDEVF
jgi:hypothetical protein